MNGAAALPLISTYGYCLPHKGLTELVQAVALLRDAGTPVRLRLVNAEFPVPVSAQLIAHLKRLVADLALSDLVEAQHAFLSDAESLRLLQEADLVVFPYQATNESASAAVRYGLASRKPVAVTPVPIFDDLGRAVHRLPGTSPRDIAAGLSATLETIARRTDTAMAVTQAAASWRDTHAYSALAARLGNILTALVRCARPHAWYSTGHRSNCAVVLAASSGARSSPTARRVTFCSAPICRWRQATTARHRRVVQHAAGFSSLRRRGIVGGSQVLMGLDLTGSSSDAVAEADFTVKRRCNDLEVRLVVDKRAEFRIDRVELSVLLIHTRSIISPRPHNRVRCLPRPLRIHKVPPNGTAPWVGGVAQAAARRTINIMDVLTNPSISSFRCRLPGCI